MTDQERELRTRLGAALREARLAKDLTQGDLAGVLETDPETISRFERGATLPSLVRLVSIAEALDVTMAQLLGGASPRIVDEWQHLAQAVAKLPERDRRLAAALVRLLIEERAGRGR